MNWLFARARQEVELWRTEEHGQPATGQAELESEGQPPTALIGARLNRDLDRNRGINCSASTRSPAFVETFDVMAFVTIDCLHERTALPHGEPMPIRHLAINARRSDSARIVVPRAAMSVAAATSVVAGRILVSR
jgi:hypothetical protein